MARHELQRIIEAESGLEAAHAWLDAMARRALPGGPVLVSLGRPRRTLDQNAKFHALCHDLGKAKAEWAGKPRTADEWKVLLVSAHAIATKHQSEIVRGIEGEFVELRESTARMNKGRSSSLIEYTLAFCAGLGIFSKED
jgi:hypothetical protein